MDLFVVERYEGDAKPQMETETAKSDHLQRLLSKIEERKSLAEEKKKEELKKKVEKKIKKKKQASIQVKEGQSVKSKAEKPNKSKPAKSNSIEKSDFGGKFTVIGDESLFAKKSEVKAKLPYWLSNPSVVSVDLKNLTVSIDDIPLLDKDLVEKLRQNGITHFFPVQQQVIPWLLEAHSKPPQFWPRDICVSAPTGSGKTFAFVLPIIQALRHRLVPHVRALVILPVQDLAVQVHKVFREYCKVTNLHVVCITGKESITSEQSKLVFYSEADGQYHSCADIVITTPGRLVDHLQCTVGFSLHHLKYLVIDEADRVMAAMQNDWLYHLDNHTSPGDPRKVPPLTIKDMSVRHPPPQKLLFSATLSEDPEKLQQLGLFQPRLFTSVVNKTDSGNAASSGFIGKFTTPAELKEYWLASDVSIKPLYLYHLITNSNWTRVLVFANTVDSVHRLAVLMKHLLKGRRTVSEVSSGVSSKERKDVLDNFASGKINVLVSSDAFTRGIDVPNIDCVISYDAPKFVKNYIHRIGRTGRAGREGMAITLVEDRQKRKFDVILSQAGKQDMVEEMYVDISTLEPLEEDYKQGLATLKTTMEEEEESKKKKQVNPKKKARKNLQGVMKSSSKISKARKISKQLKKLVQAKKL